MADLRPFCMTRSELEDFLTSLKIPFETRSHEPVFTVDALMKHAEQMPGLHHKNLFLKEKKGRCFLLVALHNRQINLNEIAKILKIGSGKLRFGDEGILWEKLGVKQGAVTIFALVNDKPKEVQLLLDSDILKDPESTVWFHPMENHATTGVSAKNLEVFLDAVGHKPTLVDFRGAEPKLLG